MKGLKRQGGWIGAAVAAGAALLSAKGAKDQQDSSEGMSARQMKFQQEQAAIARRYNRRMAKRGHQFEVKDLRKAGLNPILSAGGSGAKVAASPAPAGAMGVAQNVLGAGVNSGLDAYRQQAEIRNVDAQTALTDAKTSAIGPAAGAGEAATGLWEYVKDGFKSGESNLQKIVDDYFLSQSNINTGKRQSVSIFNKETGKYVTAPAGKGRNPSGASSYRKYHQYKSKQRSN